MWEFLKWYYTTPWISALTWLAVMVVVVVILRNTKFDESN
jgi:hypothetical protein